MADFRHTVIWQQRTPTGLAHAGQPQYLWPDKSQFYAAIERLRGAELISAQQIKAVSNFKVTLRRSSESRQIKATDRFKFVEDGSIFEIIAVLPDYSTNAYIEFTVAALG